MEEKQGNEIWYRTGKNFKPTSYASTIYIKQLAFCGFPSLGGVVG